MVFLSLSSLSAGGLVFSPLVAVVDVAWFLFLSASVDVLEFLPLVAVVASFLFFSASAWRLSWACLTPSTRFILPFLLISLALDIRSEFSPLLSSWVPSSVVTSLLLVTSLTSPVPFFTIKVLLGVRVPTSDFPSALSWACLSATVAGTGLPFSSSYIGASLPLVLKRWRVLAPLAVPGFNVCIFSSSDESFWLIVLGVLLISFSALVTSLLSLLVTFLLVTLVTFLLTPVLLVVWLSILPLPLFVFWSPFSAVDWLLSVAPDFSFLLSLFSSAVVWLSVLTSDLEPSLSFWIYFLEILPVGVKKLNCLASLALDLRFVLLSVLGSGSESTLVSVLVVDLTSDLEPSLSFWIYFLAIFPDLVKKLNCLVSLALDLRLVLSSLLPSALASGFSPPFFPIVLGVFLLSFSALDSFFSSAGAWLSPLVSGLEPSLPFWIYFLDIFPDLVKKLNCLVSLALDLRSGLLSVLVSVLASVLVSALASGLASVLASGLEPSLSLWIYFLAIFPDLVKKLNCLVSLALDLRLVLSSLLPSALASGFSPPFFPIVLGVFLLSFSALDSFFSSAGALVSVLVSSPDSALVSPPLVLLFTLLKNSSLSFSASALACAFFLACSSLWFVTWTCTVELPLELEAVALLLFDCWGLLFFLFKFSWDSPFFSSVLASALIPRALLLAASLEFQVSLTKFLASYAFHLRSLAPLIAFLAVSFNFWLNDFFSPPSFLLWCLRTVSVTVLLSSVFNWGTLGFLLAVAWVLSVAFGCGAGLAWTFCTPWANLLAVFDVLPLLNPDKPIGLSLETELESVFGFLFKLDKPIGLSSLPASVFLALLTTSPVFCATALAPFLIASPALLAALFIFSTALARRLACFSLLAFICSGVLLLCVPTSPLIWDKPFMLASLIVS